jgi:O-antigen/teichoic acid export membrane protein
MFNNGVSFLVYIIDVFLIGVITEDMNVLASYKTATLIPFALTFIPSTIMTFVYPYFANHQNDKNWVRNHYMKLLKYCLGLNLCISLFLIFFSKLIVQICFGKEYLDCVSIFIVLAIGYFFTASLRIPGGNVLASLGKIKVNFYITVAFGKILVRSPNIGETASPDKEVNAEIDQIAIKVIRGIVPLPVCIFI